MREITHINTRKAAKKEGIYHGPVYVEPAGDNGVGVCIGKFDDVISWLYGSQVVIPDLEAIFDETRITYQGVPVSIVRACCDPNTSEGQKKIMDLEKSLTIARRLLVRSKKSNPR